jgi:HSP20 family protein
MTLMRRERVGFDFPELWRRMFDNDLEAGGWLRVEEFRDGDTFVIRGELPGIDPDRDVELSLSDGVLRISARREERKEHKGDDGFRTEFRYGTFVRNVVLPPGVREEDIKASYKDGILEVRIPMPQEEKEPEAKKIPISKE